MMITVHALDGDGYELGSNSPEGEENLGEAKKRAKRLLGTPELVRAGMVKVEVRKDGVVEWDDFVRTPSHRAAEEIVSVAEELLGR